MRLFDMSSPEKIAYLYSRYPVVSQTFCDSEMLALEATGDFDLAIGSLNPPPTPFRHERLRDLVAEVHYPPPASVLSALKKTAELNNTWQTDFGEMIARHDEEYGKSFKADIRARNALYFGDRFKQLGIRHIHVHFANRATHTALFIKARTGIPFSFTAHAQDFMVDLGSDDLLRELCEAAEFVVAVSDHSAEILRQTCPSAAHKIQRVYNGIVTADFPAAAPRSVATEPLRIVSIGRMIEFKGFHHLIASCAQLRDREIPFELTLIGEGPWRERLKAQVEELGIADAVDFAGVQSQEQVKARLAASDVFALACIVDEKGASDILPTVIMEAMACGLPIVSTELVGVPEMVDHDVTGLLAQPGDETELADHLARLYSEPTLAKQLGDAGRAKAQSLFELTTTAGQIGQKIRDSLSRNECPTSETCPRAEHTEKTLYLVDQFPAATDLVLAEELAMARAFHQDTIQLYAMRSRAQIDWRKVGSLGEAEFLPDGLVIESAWEYDPDTARTLMALRPKMGTGVSTEDFYRDAKRALHLAATVAKRPEITHLHAARSATAVTTWLLHRLTGLPFSLTLEPETDLGSTAIRAITADSTNDPAEDELCLEPVDLRRRLVIGPLKIRLPGEKTLPPRGDLLREWFRRF